MLALFPQGLSDSVITTVWVGVWVMAFMNLRFGWVLSGLVTPGYLVPLLLIKPWSAAVTCVEGVVTYLLVRFLSDYASRFGYWNGLFGRDRFFALLLTSVCVRLASDTWLLPAFGAWYNTHFGEAFDYYNNLHSFGLVVVALLANQMWKPGLRRGLLTATLSIGLTLLIVRYGLMTLTNYNISSLAYMYEDFADSMLQSPKVYMLLLTTAYIASRMNLRYAWEFSGILIPALIALQWYEPLKILTSFGEALIIAALATAVLRAPIFQRMTMEGARKLLLFFNVGFVYKMTLAYLLLWLAPEYRPNDYFGFGYMLSTLIALKMHDNGLFLRLPITTLQVSAVSVLAATCVGFALSILTPMWRAPVPEAQAATNEPAIQTPHTLAEVLNQEAVRRYASRTVEHTVFPDTAQLRIFAQALQQLHAYQASGDTTVLNKIRNHFAAVDYQLLRVENRYWLLRERDPQRGWGSYVLDFAAPRKLLIEVPRPMEERGTAQAATALFLETHAMALAIAGARATSPHGIDVLGMRHSIFQTFHEHLRGCDVLALRSPAQPHQAASRLWIGGTAPATLELKQLDALVNQLQVTWKTAPSVSRQRETASASYAEFDLSTADIDRLTGRLAGRGEALDEPLREPLASLLLADKNSLAAENYGASTQTGMDELLYLDENVLNPLVNVAIHGFKHGQWTPLALTQIRAIHYAAEAVGYELARVHDPDSGQEYLFLRESRQPRHHGGAYVLRAGDSAPFSVNVPHPLFELNALEYGVTLFRSADARALLIGGADASLNATPQQPAQIYALANQVLMRDLPDAHFMVVMIRGFGIRNDTPPPKEDIMIALGDAALSPQQASPLARRLMETVSRDGFDFRLVDGSAEAADMDISGQRTALYLQQSSAREVAALWLSPLARMVFRSPLEDSDQVVQFNALDVPTLHLGLEAYLAQPAQTQADQKYAPLNRDLQQLLLRYMETHDVVTLADLHTRYPGQHIERLLDDSLHQAFLAVHDREGLMLIANLSPAQTGTVRARTVHDTEALHRFIETRSAFLDFGGEP